MSGTGGGQRRFDRVGALTIHSRTVAGPSARPVVLVSGLGISSRSMVRLAPLLAVDRPVFAVDLPGIGSSSRPRELPDLGQLADVVLAWFDVVGLDRPSLLGHSFGTQVVAHVAERGPDRVGPLVLASPTRDPAAGGPVGQALRLLLDGLRESPALLPIAAVDYLRAGPFRMWRTLRRSLHTDVGYRLSGLDRPALVVRGTRDPLVSRAWAERVTALLPQGRLVTLPGAPHAVNFSTALELAAVVRPFLSCERPG